jgi:hypothetical protein
LDAGRQELDLDAGGVPITSMVLCALFAGGAELPGTSSTIADREESIRSS